jgi:hypothetical protein
LFASYAIRHNTQTHTNRGLEGAMVGLGEHVCVQIARHSGGRRAGCGGGEANAVLVRNERNDGNNRQARRDRRTTPHTTTQASCTRATIMLGCMRVATKPRVCGGPRA